MRWWSKSLEFDPRAVSQKSPECRLPSSPGRDIAFSMILPTIAFVLHDQFCP
jgi:hypothetical protein